MEALNVQKNLPSWNATTLNPYGSRLVKEFFIIKLTVQSGTKDLNIRSVFLPETGNVIQFSSIFAVFSFKSLLTFPASSHIYAKQRAAFKDLLYISTKTFLVILDFHLLLVCVLFPQDISKMIGFLK